jgi:hypothetical protein
MLAISAIELSAAARGAFSGAPDVSRSESLIDFDFVHFLVSS